MLDKDSLNSEISVGVTFASLMAAISLFFTGAVISQYASFDASIKVPLLFLIVSTFSFIFAATIYNNAGSEITLGKIKTVEKYMVYAKNIVEFLGLYLLILATPLVIGALTADNFLRYATTIVALVSIVLYSQSKFSVLDKQLPRSAKHLYTFVIALLSGLLYMSQADTAHETSAYFTPVSIVLLIALLVPTIYFSVRSKQYRVVRVRLFRETDVTALVKLVEKNMHRYRYSKKHKKSYSNDAGVLYGDYSESAIRELASKENIFVASIGNKRIGFITLSGNTITTIFTDPDVQRKGSGRMLVEAAEVAAGAAGYEEVETITSAPSKGFYSRLDYEIAHKLDDGRIKMRKEL